MHRSAQSFLAIEPNKTSREDALFLPGLMRLDFFRWTSSAVVFAGLIAAVSSAIRTPVGEDIKVNLGSSRQAEILGGFPAGVLESWDLRGPGQKFLMFFLDSLSDGRIVRPRKPRSGRRFSPNVEARCQ